MKEKNTFVTKYLCLNQKPTILTIASKTFTFMVAGIIGAASAVFNYSRVYGGIVNRTACADPTPDSVIPFLQALGNYSFVSAHPYSGLLNLIPAANLNIMSNQQSDQHIDIRCFSPMIGAYTSVLDGNSLRPASHAFTDYLNKYREVADN